jgi:hypothetical protein
MSMLIVGQCRASHRYRLLDATAMSEADFENDVAKALMCYEPEFACVPFHGTFRFERESYRSDLALVARDASHWFVIEVELTSHSLHGHVVPQVRALRYGDPQADCIESLANGAGISTDQASRVIYDVPRSVLVAANRRLAEWENALRAVDVGLVTVSVYSAPEGERAYEVNGTLEVPIACLGFGTYSATDRGIIFSRSIGLAAGVIQIEDVETGHGLWKVIHEEVRSWVVRTDGVPSLEHGELVQLQRTLKGGILLLRARRSVLR